MNLNLTQPLDELEPGVRKQAISFICESGPLKAYLDEKLLRQMLTNLLSNALKYTQPGGAIYFEVCVKQEAVILRIEDEGIGIPQEDLPYLFEPFHRARNATAIAGTGLGLAIVKKA